MVFYRKYRPQILSELDNTKVATLIAKYLAREKLPHAFLFSGPKGTGKTSAARIVAKSLNCQEASEGQACGRCAACVSIANGQQLDILEIDAASNRGIDEIRDLREKIKLAPIQLKYKVYIIDEAHMLTTEAFNALLKTLEEPPAHAVFILATTETHKIPATILSRCVAVDFHKATQAEIIHSLARIVKAEQLKISEAALTSIAAASDGSFRDGAKLLEEVVLSGKSVSDAVVSEVIGSSEGSVLEQFLDLLKEKKAAELLELVIKLETEGKNLRQFFLNALSRLEQLLIQAVHGTQQSWSKTELLLAIKLFSHSFTEAKTAVIPGLPFELAIVEYCETKTQKAAPSAIIPPAAAVDPSGDSINATSAAPIMDKWNEILEALKPYNHSIVGVLRSCRPLTLIDHTLTIEAQYKFHAERISEAKVRDLIAKAIKEVVGLDVKIITAIKKRG